MKHLVSGLVHALIALALQLGLARVLVFVPMGTRAQATGACVASLSLLFAGLLLGIRARRRAEALTRELEADKPSAFSSGLDLLGELVRSGTAVVPWAALFVTAGALFIVGVVGFSTPVFSGVVPPSTLEVGGFARACLAADAILLPALALLTLGALLGVGTRSGTLVTSFLAFLALALGSFLGAEGAKYLSYDAGLIAAYTVAFSGAAALVVGFVVAWVRRRLGFIELVLVALYAGYAVYFGVALGPKTLIESASLPEEQIFLALVLAPTLGYAVALIVGGSVGFLLLGGGSFDAGFRYESAVALRYLRANRRDHFIGKVTLISIVGVCLGVMALIVVLSVMSGFEEDLKRKILGAHAHIVLGKTGDDFYEYDDVSARVGEVQGVASATAFVLGDGMISSDASLSGTIVKGIDLSNARGTAELRANIDKGSLDYLAKPELIPGARPRLELPSTSTTVKVGPNGRAPPIDGAGLTIRTPDELGGKILPGIVIGRELSKSLRAYVGDVVKLVSPVSEEIGPMGPQPKLRRFRVAGIFYSGMYEYDAKFTYLDLKQAQSFFGQRGKVTGVEIKVTDVDDTSRIVEELKAKVGGHPYTIKDWREMNKELFSALLLEKLAMFIILTFIILVASFNIVATLIMIVLEKGKEIAILKSIGASDASIMKIFVVQGLIVGVGGALIGLVSGVSICAFIEKFGIGLDQRVFYIERLPVVMSWGEISAIAIAAVVISYLATIYPAITAAKLRPVEGLRDD